MSQGLTIKFVFEQVYGSKRDKRFVIIYFDFHFSGDFVGRVTPKTTVIARNVRGVTAGAMAYARHIARFDGTE